jgi:prevent-host-death family protein
MHTYTLRDLRSHLSEAVRLVASGEVVAVTKRGREVARILPPTSTSSLRPLPSLAQERAAMVADGTLITTSTVVALRDEERA